MKEHLAIIDDYKVVLLKERDIKIQLAETVRGIEEKRIALLAQAYDEGVIDGKNAEVRGVQEKNILASDKDIIALVVAKNQLETDISLVEVERRYLETVVSLTKAWLYSQSGGER